MPSIKTSNIPEQVAAHLREGISSGRWIDHLPGRDTLATEFGVSPRSIQKATGILKKEGLLVARGQGRRSVIRPPGDGPVTQPIRVALLLFNNQDRGKDYVIELRLRLEHAGHIPIVPGLGLQEMGMDSRRLARLVSETKANAWVVAAGSREILQWFVDHNIQVFALAGRRFQLPIAGTGPDKFACYEEAVHKFIELGHKRIVFLCQSQLRKPTHSRSVRTFLKTMADSGIATGAYNLPDWEETTEGFQKVIDSLFKTTPPTALILDEPHLFHAAYHYLAQRGLKIPQDVSLFCMDGDHGFSWCVPSVAHISWEYQPVVRRIMRWVNNVARGVDDRRQSFTKAKYVEGGSVGPPPDR